MAIAWGRTPQDYGAAGDGGTDDTAAFLGLFQDAAAEEAIEEQLRAAELIIPPGTYRIASPLVLAASVSVYCLPGVILDFHLDEAGSPCIDWMLSGGNSRLFRPRWYGGEIRRAGASGAGIRLRAAEHGLLSGLTVHDCDPYFVIDSPGSETTESVLLEMVEGRGAGAAVAVDVGQASGSKSNHVKVALANFIGAGTGSICCRFRNGEDCEAFHVRSNTGETHTAVADQARFILTNPSGNAVASWLASDAASSGCVIGRAISAPGPGTWAVRGV